jgi:hypothetical protein
MVIASFLWLALTPWILGWKSCSSGIYYSLIEASNVNNRYYPLETVLYTTKTNTYPNISHLIQPQINSDSSPQPPQPP